jgi:GH18 family chitinase
MNSLFTLCKWRSWRFLQSIHLAILFCLFSVSHAQVSPAVPATTAQHKKQVIGYITQWDAWKEVSNLVPKGGFNHLNVDYSQYTILNFSFFGVAKDGSLHSGDFRNKNIYQAGAVQEPAALLNEDIYSSWDLFLLYGELETLYHISDGSYAYSLGYRNEGGGWKNVNTGKTGAFPLSVHKQGGAPGILELAHAKGVKVMASIGGWSMCKHYPEMAADAAKRAKFVANCKELIAMGFDGIDFDWEYPNDAGMNIERYSAADYNNFATLLEEVRAAIGSSKLITSCFSAVPSKLSGFNWTRMNAVLNYMNMMTYDYNGGWSNKAGHNAPLYDYPGMEYTGFSLNGTVQGIRNLGIDMSKVNLGAPFYGRGVVTSSAATLNGATAKRAETVQPDGPVQTCADFTNWAKDLWDGTPSYSYIQQATASGSGWTEYWDDVAMVPYKVKGNYFLSYDNERSIEAKAQYIKDQGLAGVIIWQVYGDMTDMTSSTVAKGKLIFCPNTKSKLVNKINQVFANGNNTGKVIVGYWHNWGSTAAPPYIRLRDVNPKYNVIQVAFGESNADLATINFIPANTTPAEFISDIQALQAQGRKVLLSLGGQNGTLILSTAAAKQAFVNSMKALLDQYNFDGFDIDLEGGHSLQLDNGDNNFMNPTTPKVVNLIAAIKEIISYRKGKGKDCWLTMAPETYYVQTAYGNNYSPLVGAYLPVIYGLRNELTFIHPQYYNTGSVTGMDNKVYSQATPDFIVAMSEMLLAGFPVAGTNQTFPALREDQVAFGLPAVQAAAPSGGYLAPAGVKQALNYLTKGQSFGGAYTLRKAGGYPGLRGIMTWSINWDKTNNDEFANNYYEYFFGNSGGNTPPVVRITSPANNATFTSPATVTITASASDADGSISKVEFYNGAAKLGEATASPYTYAWTNVTTGTYTLTAKATDNNGAVTTSAAVTVTVSGNSGSGNCAGVAEYQPYPKIYSKGDKVTYNGYLYESLSDALYNVTPGTADWWWKPLGACSVTTLTTAATSVATTIGGVAVVPNPITGNTAQVLKYAEAGDQLIVEVRNLRGYAVSSHSFTAAVTGVNSFSISTGSLTTGIWTVSITNKKTGNVSTTRLVKP